MDWRRLGGERGLESGYPNEEPGMSICRVVDRISSIDRVLLGLECSFSITTGACIDESSSPRGMDGIAANHAPVCSVVAGFGRETQGSAAL